MRVHCRENGIVACIFHRASLEYCDEDAAMKFSIIVPVYNSQDYLRECVSSITAQTHRDVEILLVDDGSTDDSGKLCDQLGAEDSRIIVIHKENGGTSSARNAGVAHASGDYITFCDNDDFFRDLECLEQVASYLDRHPVDVLMHDNCTYDSPSGTLFPPKATNLGSRIADMKKSDAILEIASQGLMSRAVWDKVVKTSLIRNHNIVFPEGMRNEDTDWTASVFETADSIGWIDNPYYCYRKGHEYAQTAKPVTRAMTDDLARIICKHMAIIDNRGLSKQDAHAIYAYLAYPYIVWMGQSASNGDCSKSDSTAVEMSLHAPKLFGAHEDPAVATANLFYRLCGFWTTAMLLGRAYRASIARARRHS